MQGNSCLHQAAVVVLFVSNPRWKGHISVQDLRSVNDLGILIDQEHFVGAIVFDNMQGSFNAFHVRLEKTDQLLRNVVNMRTLLALQKVVDTSID